MFKNAIRAIDWMEKNGFKPDWHTDTPQSGGKASQAGNGKQLLTVCPIHNEPMKVRQGDFGVFTSHYLGEDASGKAILQRGCEVVRYFPSCASGQGCLATEQRNGDKTSTYIGMQRSAPVIIPENIVLLDNDTQCSTMYLCRLYQ